MPIRKINTKISDYPLVADRTTDAFYGDMEAWIVHGANTTVDEQNALKNEINNTVDDINIAANIIETTASVIDQNKIDAQNARDVALAAKSAVETIYDTFDDRYLGAKTTTPTLDNDGNALQSGALYFNSSSGKLFIYDLVGVKWVDITIIPTLLSSLSDVAFTTKANNDILQYNSTSGKWVNRSFYSKAELDATLSTKADESQVIKTTGAQDVSANINFTGNITISGTLIQDHNIYSLGIAGEIGFGVATAKDEDWQTAGLIPLPGHDNITSANYANYMHMSSGAIMVHIPKHYFKLTGNLLEFSDIAKTGYVLDRSFINASKELNGIFVSKYGGTNNNGKFSSQRKKAPLSTNSANNPISSLDGAPSNTYGGLYTAVKTMSSKAFLTPIYVYMMLARLALAHGKAATSTAACAYIDVNPKMPKGNLNNALKDVNDSSVTFVSSGYSNCALTGSGSPFAKTTHNGQDCGIADLTGNMWEVASGFIRTDALGFLVLKESVDVTTIVNDSTAQGGGGAYDIDLYDVIDISDLVNSNAAWTYLGNGSNQVFGFSTDRASDTYKRTSLGIPLAIGVSGAGTTEFGNDGIYRYLRNEMACRVGGDWGNSSYAGLFCVHLSHSRADSGSYTGGRASLYAL